MSCQFASDQQGDHLRQQDTNCLYKSLLAYLTSRNPPPPLGPPPDAPPKPPSVGTLNSLLIQEQKEAYRRIDYMSDEWQARLYEISGLNKHSFPLTHFPPPPQSPRSAMDPFAASSRSSAPPRGINTNWRKKVSDWMYRVIDHFDLDRDLVGIGIFYLDKYLEANYSTDTVFELAAIASIYLAIKLHSQEKIHIHVIATLGRAFSVEQIAAMEIRIANSLGWLLHPPTAVAFLRGLQPTVMECLARDEVRARNVVEFAKFLSELSVCEYSLIEAKPSSVSIASILSGMQYLRFPRDILELFLLAVANAIPNLEIDEVEIRECSLKLKQIYELAMPNDLTNWGKEVNSDATPASPPRCKSTILADADAR